MNLQTFKLSGPIKLESGQTLTEAQVCYLKQGKPNADGSNIVWVCHALTASADVTDWWEGLFGVGQFFDPERYCIICANILGSCYGSTGPLSISPDYQAPYYHFFPDITIRDIVRMHIALRQKLGIERIGLLIGASLGGQQALEWAVMEPERIQQLALIATNARHSPWGIAFNESQRLAIQADPTWLASKPKAGMAGMKAARAIAMLSYRSYQTYQADQLEEVDTKLDGYKAASYQTYQGEKLCKRFNAYSYWKLSKAMDSHHVGRGRGPFPEVLATIRARTLAVGIRSDLLFPVAEQQYLSEHIPGATYAEIDSRFGHDGFLIETQTLQAVFQQFLSPAHPSETSAREAGIPQTHLKPTSL